MHVVFYKLKNKNNTAQICKSFQSSYYCL